MKNNTPKKYLLFFIGLLFLAGCGAFDSLSGGDDLPEEVVIPSNPLEAAAVRGLITSYKESTMWQIQKVNVKGTTPMAPTGVLLELQDPKEVYCVCLDYEARYKVSWSTSDGSPWEKTVRNILVIKTQDDQFIPLKPMNICPAFCN
jgi:hypothetical protein